MMLLNFAKRLVALMTGLGYTFIGVALGGFFFAPGVNTNIAFAILVAGVIFIIAGFVFDTLLDSIDDRGG